MNKACKIPRLWRLLDVPRYPRSDIKHQSEIFLRALSNIWRIDVWCLIQVKGEWDFYNIDFRIGHFPVQYLISDIWYLISDIWCLMSEIWYLICDVWSLISDVWCRMHLKDPLRGFYCKHCLWFRLEKMKLTSEQSTINDFPAPAVQASVCVAAFSVDDQTSFGQRDGTRRLYFFSSRILNIDLPFSWCVIPHLFTSSPSSFCLIVT